MAANQRWTLDDGHIVNQATGLVLEADGKREVYSSERRRGADNQRWEYSDNFIICRHAGTVDTYVLDIVDHKEYSHVCLNRKHHLRSDDSQKWDWSNEGLVVNRRTGWLLSIDHDHQKGGRIHIIRRLVGGTVGGVLGAATGAVGGTVHGATSGLVHGGEAGSRPGGVTGLVGGVAGAGLGLGLGAVGGAVHGLGHGANVGAGLGAGQGTHGLVGNNGMGVGVGGYQQQGNYQQGGFQQQVGYEQTGFQQTTGIQQGGFQQQQQPGFQQGNFQQGIPQQQAAQAPTTVIYVQTGAPAQTAPLQGQQQFYGQTQQSSYIDQQQQAANYPGYGSSTVTNSSYSNQGQQNFPAVGNESNHSGVGGALGAGAATGLGAAALSHAHHGKDKVEEKVHRHEEVVEKDKDGHHVGKKLLVGAGLAAVGLGLGIAHDKHKHHKEADRDIPSGTVGTTTDYTSTTTTTTGSNAAAGYYANSGTGGNNVVVEERRY